MDREEVYNKLFSFLSAIHQWEDSLLTGLSLRDLTQLQLNILMILYFSGPKNLSALSSCLHINLPNCSREVKKLTESGFLKKQQDSNDRRITTIALETSGLDYLGRYIDEVKTILDSEKTALDNSKLKDLERGMALISSALFSGKG